jgi:molybdopterin molybdotransferase
MATLCPAYERLSMKVKPGKPAAFGRLPGAVWLAIPGNAFAAFVVFLILGRPLIQILSGRPGRLGSPGRPATASFCWSRKTGRDEFFPVREIGLDDEGLPLLEKLGRGGSARLRPLVEGDGLAMAGAEIAQVRPGTQLSYLAFSEALCG